MSTAPTTSPSPSEQARSSSSTMLVVITSPHMTFARGSAGGAGGAGVPSASNRSTSCGTVVRRRILRRLATVERLVGTLRSHLRRRRGSTHPRSVPAPSSTSATCAVTSHSQSPCRPTWRYCGPAIPGAGRSRWPSPRRRLGERDRDQRPEPSVDPASGGARPTRATHPGTSSETSNRISVRASPPSRPTARPVPARCERLVRLRTRRRRRRRRRSAWMLAASQSAGGPTSTCRSPATDRRCRHRRSRRTWNVCVPTGGSCTPPGWCTRATPGIERVDAALELHELLRRAAGTVVGGEREHRGVAARIGRCLEDRGLPAATGRACRRTCARPGSGRPCRRGRSRGPRT